MQYAGKKIQSFTDLVAWKEGHKLVLMIYEQVKKFPANEKFGLSSQLSRAVVSITSNIAEGFSRRGTKEKTQFYFTALGSLREVQNQLLIARDIRILSSEDFSMIADQTVIVSKLITGLIKSIRRQ